MTNKAMLVVMVLVAAGSCGGETAVLVQQPERTRTVLLFVDVTSSLTQIQIDRVIETVGTIIQGMRNGTNLFVYAIQSDPQATTFRNHQFARPQNLKEAHRAEIERIALQHDVGEDIFDLYCSINWNDERTKEACRNRQILPSPQNDLRSCILGTLTHISRKIADLNHAGKGPVHVIYVSDMIEECDRNPLGQMIKLTHPDLKPDVANIERFQQLPDLGGVRLTVIVPRTPAGQPDPRMPAFDDLRAYWGAIFAKCNTKWRFESDVPEDLQPPPLSH
jgi:hypothetical protein